MRGFALALVGALLATGCGSDGPAGPGRGAAGRIPDGTYEVGKDLRAGVYTAAPDCVGTISSRPDHSQGMDADPDAFLGGSVLVRDVQRIVLERGQFFLSEVCRDGWLHEDRAGPVTPDPARRAGACTILLGDGLVEDALEVLVSAAGSGVGGMRVGEVQNRLMAVVFARTPRIWQHAGEMVDFLDAPDAFVEGGQPEPRVTRAVDAIERICG